MTTHSNDSNQSGRPQAPQKPAGKPLSPPPQSPTPIPVAPVHHPAPQQSGIIPPYQPPHDFTTPPTPGHRPDPQQAQQPLAAPRPQATVDEVSQSTIESQPEAEPPQKFIKTKSKPNRLIKSMQLIMSITFFAAIGLAGFVMFTRHQVDKPGPLTQTVIFEVGKGQGLNTISARLHKDGIISNKRLFAMHAVTSKTAKKLKAGKYSIPQGASMQAVLDILVRGKAIYYQVTLPEGWTSEQIVNVLKAHPQLAGSINEVPAEGSLMPDTFQFSEGANRQKLLTTMADAQKKFLATLWSARQQNLPLKTPQEALILASIVEKETGRSSERKRVAGVFINRLRKGMKLQSDPTIIYGLVGGKGRLGHPLRRSEMKKKTGYNTYQIQGLPPTPIANPGRKSIEAVLNPADTKDLFFVADGTGGHAFAPNLRLHNKNVSNWRKIEAERRREKKRKEAELKRLAKLEKQKIIPQKSMPGITVTPPGQTPLQASKLSVALEKPSSKATSIWGNDIPLPTRKPH